MRELWIFASFILGTLWGCQYKNDSSEDETDTSERTGTSTDTYSDSVTICRESGTNGNSPYSVKIDGEPVEVFRIPYFDVAINYVRVVFSKEVDVEIESVVPIESFLLSPKRRGIEASHDDKRISFTVREPEYLMLNPSHPDKVLENLVILIDPPETDPPLPGDSNVVNIMTLDGVDNCGETLMTDVIQGAIDDLENSKKILYFPKGTYLTGELFMRSGMTLHLAEGAVLKGSDALEDIVTDNEDGSTVEQCLHALIRMNGVTDSHISGRGTIDANGTRHRIEENSNTKYNLLKIEESTDCTVDGVLAVDSSFWNTIIYRSKSIHITNYKVINNWKNLGWNETDGVNFDNAQNSSLRKAFLYVGDDCMSTKSDDIPDDYTIPEEGNHAADPTVGKGAYIPVDDILHEDVVCFTNQVACKIGTKTMGGTMSNIVFSDIDVLNCGRGMVIDNWDTALVKEVSFENVEFEYFGPYTVAGFAIEKKNDWRDSEGKGGIDRILIRNVVLNDFGNLKPQFNIEGRVDNNTQEAFPIGEVTFEDLILDGVHIVNENVGQYIRLIREQADSITFE